MASAAAADVQTLCSLSSEGGYVCADIPTSVEDP